MTNHAMLAIDALESFQVLPEHDVVIVDEGHELVDRVTGVATGELTVPLVTRAATRRKRLLDDDVIGDLLAAGDALEAAVATLPDGRVVDLPEQLATAVALVRDAARAAQSELTSVKDADDGARKLAQAAAGEVFDIAERLAAHSPYDVTWVTHDERRGSSVKVAPLAVGGLLREALFGHRTVVMTSATLELGGSFDAVARQVGPDRRRRTASGAGSTSGRRSTTRRQGILYVARTLPPPGRDGASPASMDELAALVEAAGGRTLGLFSSMRAAQAAAEEMRSRLDVPVLCQGEDRTAALVRAVRGRPGDLPVRDAVAVAGRRRAGGVLPAGRDRPHPVPAARRPADVGARAGGQRRGRQRVHGGVGGARRADARPGVRPADPPLDRPGSGRRAGLAAGDSPLRRRSCARRCRRSGSRPTTMSRSERCAGCPGPQRKNARWVAPADPPGVPLQLATSWWVSLRRRDRSCRRPSRCRRRCSSSA